MHGLRFRRLASALAVLAVAACGSRSGLHAPEAGGQGGAGGGSTSASSSSATSSSTSTSASTTETTSTTTSQGGGGEGGGGGPQGPCATLEYAVPFTSLQGGMNPDQLSPKLAYSADDGSRVTLGSAWKYVDAPGAPIELRRTSLSPWPDFPAGTSLGNTNYMDLDGGVSYAMSTSTSDRFAMLFADFKEGPAGGLRFSADFDPDEDNPPDTFLVDPVAQTALFLAHGTRFLWGGAYDNGPSYEIRAGMLDEDSPDATFLLGCAETPPLADAVALGGSFLVGMASGTPTLPGDCDMGPFGSASRLQTARIAADGAIESFSEIALDVLSDVRLAPRSDGAWLAWTDAGGEDTPARIRIGRLTSSAELSGELDWNVPFSPGSLAVTSFQDHLVLAWIAAEPEGASPHVQVFDPNLVPLGGIKVEATGMAKGQLALIGSPFDRQAVLAWSETASAGDQIRLTRVDCLDK